MIQPERAQRIAEIVEAALEGDANDWPSFLDEACGDDPSLRKEVEIKRRRQISSKRPPIKATQTLLRRGAAS
jgi:hypothetical protein